MEDYLGISNFLNCTRSFVNKVRRELEASADNVEIVASTKTMRYVRTQFVKMVQFIYIHLFSLRWRKKIVYITFVRRLAISDSLDKQALY